MRRAQNHGLRSNAACGLKSSRMTRFAGDPIPPDLRELIAAEARSEGLEFVFVQAHDAEAYTFEVLCYRDERDPEWRLWIRAHRVPPNMPGAQKFVS